ncbi:MAG: rubrerythrin [Roseivirga sp.]
MGFLTEPYLAINDEEIGASDSFQTPIPTYYRLYKVSQENRQIQQVNQTYIKMEDVKLRQFLMNIRPMMDLKIGSVGN